MEGTRLRILQLLQRNQNDTVDGLAKAIGLAPATIRRHLDILQRDLLVAFQEVRKRTGRPEYSFYLTESGQEALPKGYDQLLGMTIQAISALTAEDTRSKNGQRILDLVFKRLADQVTLTYEDELKDKGLSQRLSILIHHLGQEDFLPEANADQDTLRIKLVNCPFRSVALQDKSVCTFDLNLISSMLDLDVERAKCIHDGDGSCMYTASVGEEDQQELLSFATS